ncbi:nitrate reductase associated protein [Pseudanabaena sp. PCC 6802]|uniref:nitrate reductase associated protein n=1 Tax=Pseudanabaena sp. PCC 6802 TaxID=118173 RepID=UPI00034D786F|nr:nitrate reductase associated protein [Pseudanabaena sp. PCC 6802]
MNDLFNFEADFVESLRCIPMQVRFKLDTCGIKLKLAEWHKFSRAQRQLLVDMPCKTQPEVQNYHQFLQDLIRECTGDRATPLTIDPEPAWEDAQNIPAEVQAKLQEVGAVLSPAQWAGLLPLQRFVLIKLSRSSHENSNFVPALKEFQLLL